MLETRRTVKLIEVSGVVCTCGSSKIKFILGNDFAKCSGCGLVKPHSFFYSQNQGEARAKRLAI